MAFLRNISDRFWSYVSPQKTQRRRDKPFKPEVLPIARRAGSRFDPKTSMSPTTKMNSWTVKTPTLGSYSAEPELTTPATLERPYTDFEGDTLIDQLVSDIGASDDEAWDANEETVVVDEAHYEEKDYKPSEERRRREKQADALRDQGWAEDAVFLYQKVAMRGFEPLMPKSWAADFVMMPDSLFTDNNDEAFIKSAHGNDFRGTRLTRTPFSVAQLTLTSGTKALKALLEVGARTRDCIISESSSRNPEEIIRRGIWSFMKWASTDGKVDRPWNTSVLVFESGGKEVPIAKLQANMLKKLGNLAKEFKDTFRIRSSVEPSDDDGEDSVEPPSEEEYTIKMPTLYGVIASHTVMGFVAYDTLAETPTLKTVAMFDYGQEGYDVWNSLAVAILVIHCRNVMAELAPLLPQLLFSASASDDEDA